MALELTADDAARAVRDGEPLLVAGRIAVEPAEIADELRRVAANLAETAERGTPALDAATRLAHAPIEIARLLGPALENDRAALEREAFTLSVDASALAELVQLALQPALWEAATQARVLTDTDRWDRGYCVLCGSWPGLAELVGTERRRVLRCVRCGSGWSWLVLLCPYCGTDDHRDLGSLALASGERTGGRAAPYSKVDTCERCKGYVKAISAFTQAPAPRLVAEDIATLGLDIAATDAGYQRPGDVDARIAGIPRLAREGRASG